MQQNIPLTNQYLQILQEINNKLDRKSFCKLHNISKSKISRILSGENMPTLELLDYLGQHAGQDSKKRVKIIFK